MSLLDASFDRDLLEFDPLMNGGGSSGVEIGAEAQNVEQQDSARSERAFSSHFSQAPFSSAPSLKPSSVACSSPHSDLLIDFGSAPTPPRSAPKQLLLPTATQRKYPSALVRSPSPLKQVLYEDSVSSEEGTEQEDSRLEEERVSVVKVAPSPVKSYGKKWSVVSKMNEKRRERSRSSSPVKDVGLLIPSSGVEDESTCQMSFGTGDFSLIADEAGSFLMDMTTNSFALSAVGEEDEENVSLNRTGDMRQILHGLGDSVMERSKSTSSILPPSLTSSTRHARQQQPTINTSPVREEESFDHSFLNASTASFKEYRDSPVKPRIVSIQAERITEERDGDATPRKPKRSMIQEEAGEDSPMSGTDSSKSGDLGLTGMLREWHGEEAATGEIHAQSPPTAVIRSEPTLTMELGLVSPIKPVKVVPVPPLIDTSVPPPTPAVATPTRLQPIKDISTCSPKSLFDTMAHRSVRSLERVATGSPRKDVSSTSIDLINMSNEMTEEKKAAQSTSETSTERLRRRIEEIHLRKKVNPTPTTNRTLMKAPRPSISSTPLAKPSFTASASIVKAPTSDRAPPTPSVISTPAPKPRAFASRPSGIGLPSSAAINPSARKETTRERLDRAKEERRRRETRSPEKPVASQHATASGSTLPGATKAPSRVTVAPTTSKLPPHSSTSTSRPTLAQALAKPTSLSSGSKFAPSTATSRLGANSLRTATKLPPTSAAAPSIASKQAPSLSSLTKPRASTASSGKGSVTIPLASSRGLKRPSLVGTGLPAARSRVPLGGIQAPLSGVARPNGIGGARSGTSQAKGTK